jgi:adenylate cyclase
MKLEIERKFLLKNESWKAAVVSSSKLSDGLLSSVNGNKVRVRSNNARGLITIKGPAACLSRVELEYEIPLADSEYMLLNLCGANVCCKIRHFVPHNAHVWHVDVYEDVLLGFVIAEIELEDENETFTQPDWIGLEVTGNAHYGKWATLKRYTAIEDTLKSSDAIMIQHDKLRLPADVKDG